MLRIHFEGDDLARVRVAAGPDPMWEIVLSMQMLGASRGALVFRRWRREMRHRLSEEMRWLAALAAPAAYFPDFLTPDENTNGVEGGIDTVLATPRSRIARELELVTAHRRLPAWCRPLAEGDLAAVKQLGAALRAYERRLLRPVWPMIQAHVDADRALRSRTFLDLGIDGVLARLGPALRWKSPVLEADYPVDRDLHLNGRGLLLVPSFFCWRRPVTLAAAHLRPVLVYPISHELRHVPTEGETGVASGGRSLAALLGGTRASVLRVIEDGCTTTELARRSETSVPSASQHAKVLRDAGLITTQRYGAAVLHALTPLGRTLLING